MHVYFGKEFTAAAAGAVVRDVTCEKCGCAYHYRLVRRGEGHAHSPYNLNNLGAERRAHQRAQRRLAKMLERDVDPVACPDCGWIQHEMVRQFRRRRLRWMNIVALVFGCLFGLIILIWLPVATKGFDRKMNNSDAAATAVMAALLVVFAGGPLLLRWILLRLIRPNRRYPERPARIPGAPAAYRTGEAPAVDDDASIIEPSGWATIQLLDLPPPAECCYCLEPTARPREFKPGNLAVVNVSVCDGCWKSYRWSQWFWTLTAGLIVFVAAYAALRGQKMEENERLAGAGVAAFFALIPALLIANKFVAPVRFSRFNGTLNTVRIRFRNPEYLPLFLLRYRGSRVEPATHGD